MKDNYERTASGCEMMEKLWEAGKDCHLDEPGFSGTPARVSSFITCANIPKMMKLAALKCWEERSKHVGTNPYALFTPLDLSDDSENSTKENTSASSSKKSQQSATPKS